MALRALVKDGCLRLDEPTTLPEGTVLDLVVDDEGDDLDAEGREALHKTLAAAYRAAQAGDVRPSHAIIDELRRR